ncbi:MAG: methyltransferase domain-containing protein [Anaerolineales bacterium]|nr:methyltransferase domain-containing protein [Anaerolineales bacterium]
MFLKFKSLFGLILSKPRSYNPKAYWIEQGETYKQKYHERFEKRLQENGYDRNIGVLMSTLHEFDFKSILDVGCGYGLYLQVIEQEFPDLDDIQGCDISLTQLEEAREFLGPDSRVKLSETDGIHLPYPDKHFDIVITYGVCIHVADNKIEDFLLEILRVARQAYIFIESSSFINEHSYFAHNYPDIFAKMGAPLEIRKELDPKHKERLYVADLR